MTSGPEQPFRGIEYPSLENSPRPPADPYAPVDYPGEVTPGWASADAGLPPPVYSAPYPGAPGYPDAAGYPTYSGGHPYQTDPYDPYRPMKPPGTNGKAIAALVTSLVGVFFCGLPSIAGLILGFVAMRETRRTGQDGFGIALAGAIIGGLVVALWMLYLLVMVVIAASGFQFTP